MTQIISRSKYYLYVDDSQSCISSLENCPLKTDSLEFNCLFDIPLLVSKRHFKLNTSQINSKFLNTHTCYFQNVHQPNNWYLWPSYHAKDLKSFWNLVFLSQPTTNESVNSTDFRLSETCVDSNHFSPPPLLPPGTNLHHPTPGQLHDHVTGILASHKCDHITSLLQTLQGLFIIHRVNPHLITTVCRVLASWSLHALWLHLSPPPCLSLPPQPHWSSCSSENFPETHSCFRALGKFSVWIALFILFSSQRLSLSLYLKQHHPLPSTRHTLSHLTFISFSIALFTIWHVMCLVFYFTCLCLFVCFLSMRMKVYESNSLRKERSIVLVPDILWYLVFVKSANK